MPDTLVALSAVEEAYLSQVLTGHAATVRAADERRNAMIDVLLMDKGIPTGTPVRTKARAGDQPAYLVYEVSAGSATPDAPKQGKRPVAAGRGKKK